MSSCEFENLLPDYCGGDLGRDKQAFVKDHLDSCDSCKKLVKELSDVQELLAHRSRPKPSAELLKEYRSALSAQFRPAAKVRRGVIESITHLITGNTIPVRVVQVTCLLLVGLLLGRLIFAPSQQEQMVSTPEPLQHKQDLIFIHDFLEESEMILLEIVNRDLSKMSEYPDDFLLEASTAQRLLMRTFILHQYALHLQIEGLPELLTQIELILYELANTDALEHRDQLLWELKDLVASHRLLARSRELRGRIEIQQRSESKI